MFSFAKFLNSHFLLFFLTHMVTFIHAKFFLVLFMFMYVGFSWICDHRQSIGVGFGQFHLLQVLQDHCLLLQWSAASLLNVAPFFLVCLLTILWYCVVVIEPWSLAMSFFPFTIRLPKNTCSSAAHLSASVPAQGSHSCPAHFLIQATSLDSLSTPP